jgi:hypothetical protein
MTAASRRSDGAARVSGPLGAQVARTEGNSGISDSSWNTISAFWRRALLQLWPSLLDPVMNTIFVAFHRTPRWPLHRSLTATAAPLQELVSHFKIDNHAAPAATNMQTAGMFSLLNEVGAELAGHASWRISTRRIVNCAAPATRLGCVDVSPGMSTRHASRTQRSKWT